MWSVLLFVLGEFRHLEFFLENKNTSWVNYYMRGIGGDGYVVIQKNSAAHNKYTVYISYERRGTESGTMPQKGPEF